MLSTQKRRGENICHTVDVVIAVADAIVNAAASNVAAALSVAIDVVIAAARR